MSYQEHKHYDTFVILLTIGLVIFGWINIYAACLSDAHRHVFDFSVQHGKQIIWIVAAVVLAFFILLVNSRLFSNFAYIFYTISIVLLIVTLAIGKSTNGGQSWFDFGFFKFQPSEFAKFATALALAKYVSGLDVDFKRTKTWVYISLLILIPAGLIILQHDVGSALVFCSFLIPLYRFGLSPRLLIIGLCVIVVFVLSLLVNHYILLAIFLGIALFYLYIWKNQCKRKDVIRVSIIFALCAVFVFGAEPLMNKTLGTHQINRIKVLINPNYEINGVGYNVQQSKIAIGSGGVSGKGFTNGTITKAHFVPEQETDFIFCTIGEEYGFIGSSLVCIAYCILLVYLVSMAERQFSAFSRFYGYCVASILFFHFLINVGMVLGLVPVIGIPLPFFSYGGSSLFGFTLLLFIFIRLDAEKSRPL